MRDPEPGSPAADLALILAHVRLRLALEKREAERAGQVQPVSPARRAS